MAVHGIANMQNDGLALGRPSPASVGTICAAAAFPAAFALATRWSEMRSSPGVNFRAMCGTPSSSRVGMVASALTLAVYHSGLPLEIHRVPNPRREN